MNFEKIMKRIFFIAYLLLLVILTDFIYKVFFEKLPPLQNSVYLQFYGDSIHQRSNIEGPFYELKPNSKLANNTASSFKIKDTKVNKLLVSLYNLFVMPQDIVINSFGMRDKEIKLKKDNFRILVLGDSVTFAFEVSQDERFTEVAEKIVNKNVRKCEILNAGVCGYNTIQEFIALKEKYLKLKPDLVIFAYSMNDLERSKIQFLPDEYPQKFILNHGKKPQGFIYPNISNREYLSLVLPKQFLQKILIGNLC